MVDTNRVQAMIKGWEQGVDAAFQQRQAALGMSVPATPPEPSFLESVGEGVEDVVNGAATVGNAALYAVANNPEAVVEVVGGLALAGLGTAVASGGVVLDATGVGAVVGVPANIAGAGMIVAGGGLAFDGARRLAETATDAPPVEPMQVNWGNEKKTQQTNQEIAEHQQKSGKAAQDAQKNLNDPIPEDTPPLFRQQESKKSGWFW